MGIPAWGVCFGPETNDPSNGYYNIDATGVSSVSAIVQAVLDNTTLCPLATDNYYPTSGVGAGGLSGVGQVLHFDGRGKYRVGTKLTVGNLNLIIHGNGCVFQNQTGGNTVWEFTGGGAGNPFVHNLELNHFLVNGGNIKFTAGHKPRVTLNEIRVTACPVSVWGIEFGQQTYWLKLLRCSIRQCGGGIKLPGVSSDLSLVEDCDFAWNMDLPDIQINSSGTRILRGDFEARQIAYTSVPHIEIFPNNPDSDSEAYAVIDGAHFGGEVDNGSSDTETSSPPAYCIRVGGAAVSTTPTRSRIDIRNCKVTVNQDPNQSTGPSATSSNGFLLINTALQNSTLFDNDFTQANAYKGFYGYVVQSGYADAGNYVTNTHSNYYRGNRMANVQANGLFSPGASLGWLPI